jgi:hypothetical protein
MNYAGARLRTRDNERTHPITKCIGKARAGFIDATPLQ